MFVDSSAPPDRSTLVALFTLHLAERSAPSMERRGRVAICHGSVVQVWRDAAVTALPIEEGLAE